MKLVKSIVKASQKAEIKENENNVKTIDLKSENMKLIGEIEILRNKLKILEKQNFELKEQKSKAILFDMKTTDKLKKEVNILKVENKIKENQLRVFKKTKLEPVIDIKWALSKAESEVSFNLIPFEYKRLKFLKEYFYYDFCQFESKKIIAELKKKIHKFKEFLGFYILFSCKIDVFKEFYSTILMNPNFSEDKIELFETLPLDWTLNFNNDNEINLVKEFIEINYKDLLMFLNRIVDERPFLLNIIITKSMFTEIIKISNRASKRFVSEISKKGGLSLIDHTNIHLIPKSDLKIIYQSSFFDITF